MQLSPLYKQRLAEATQQGIQAERRTMIENVLRVRFGTLDEQLTAVVTAMLTLPPEEFTALLLQLSRSELLTKFSQDN